MAFGERVASRITARRRALSKLLNSPPGFGFRGIGADWMEHLRELGRTGGDSLAVTSAEAGDLFDLGVDRLRRAWTPTLRAALA